MQIIEIKNNLVRINYNSSQDNLVLSGFVVIKDENISFIAQIMHLEANLKGSFAIVKLIFTFDDSGVINNYNGAIPNPTCEISQVDSQELLEIIKGENPLYLGNLAQQNVALNLDIKLFEENLLVCSEHTENNHTFIKNVASQLVFQNKKVLIIDEKGEISQNKLTAGENFKLPLNYETIDFIYERGLDDASPESKALIQEIFLEVQNYVKTIPDKFIPFDLFKNVVDEQYKTLGLVELVLLKNKLLKYNDAGIFAQDKNEFINLETSLDENALTVLDVSKMEPKIQREMISYAYSVTSSREEEVFVIINLDDSNSDKKLLKQIFMAKNAHPILVCPYAYKYLNELKQLAKNLVLFSPIQQQQDFASYNAFLNKLNSDEYIVFGKSTHNIPFIVKLDESPQQFKQIQPVQAEPEPDEEEYNEPQEDETAQEEITFEPVDEMLVPLEEDFSVETIEEATDEKDEEKEPNQDLLDEQIKQDVETLYTVPQEEINQAEGSLTEDDLDFIETLNADSDFDEEFFAQNVEEDQQEFADDVIIEDEPYQEPAELNDSQIEERLLPQSEDDENLKELLGESESEFLEEEDEQVLDILPASETKNSIPIYSAQIPPKEGLEASEFEQGDTVTHVKYGKGVIEKMITYGTKTLCSIQFDNVGRRLLDPTLAELKKI